MEHINMKEDRVTMFAILSILLIQLGVLLSNEFRFSRIENKIDQYFAPIYDVELPCELDQDTYTYLDKDGNIITEERK